MTLLRHPLVRIGLVVVAAVVAALGPLLLLDGTRRANGYRVFTVLLGLLALRAIYRFGATSPPLPDASPFRGGRRLGPGARSALQRAARVTTGRGAEEPERSPTETLLRGAEERAGHFHFRLRPVLQDIADERLRSRHGIGVDDARAADMLGPVAWDHLRPDRPAPRDRRGRGPSAETLDEIVTRVEAV